MTTKRQAGRDAITDAPTAAANDVGQDGRFLMKRDGLMFKDGDRTAYKVSGHFDVLSETRDDGAQTWGLWLRFCDRDGITQQIVATRDLFTGEGGELRNLLARRGLYVNPSKGAGAALCEYLAKLASPRRARVVSRTGWHRIDGARVFVLPDEVFGKSPIEVIYQPPLGDPSLFNVAGTLDEWRDEVAALCVGNTRLVLAVSTAFAAPLLDLAAEEGGGLHLRGASRIGKTTALRLAASVWGGEPGAGAGAYIRQWRVTSNAVEGVAAAHSDTLLPLDELGQADARDVGGVAYMLANGQGKSRMDRGAALRAPVRFRTLFLSTGELGLADKIAEAGGKVKAGQEVRLVDLAADAGVGLGLFESLHGAPSAGAFTQILRDATARFYGAAAVAFLRYLTDRADRDPDLSEMLRAWIDSLVREWLDPCPAAGGQVRSVGRRFALIAIAGELATEAGVTGWDPHDAIRGVQVCFMAWLAERGTIGAREDAQAVSQMRAFIQRHGPTRFEVWREPSAAIDAMGGDPDSVPPPEGFRAVNRAGWRRWIRDGMEPSGWLYYVAPDAMREALAGLDFRPALRVLVEGDFLATGSGGKSSQPASPPGHHKIRLYVVRGSILGADEISD